MNRPNDPLPLPSQDVFGRMKLVDDGRTDPVQALDRVQVQNGALQDFRPLTACLEWELSELHWERQGLRPFVEEEVPFLVNNSGRLSEHAAAVLYANCLAHPGSGPIRVLELGAGTGLFARYFLDAFQAICEQEGKDFHTRLVYHASDRSMRTVAQWCERGLFDGHDPARVIPGCCDALQPGRLVGMSGQIVELRGMRAVFCNYVLDVLPATVLRTGVQGAEELHVRTRLTEDRALVAQYTRLSPAALHELARSTSAQDKARLVPLMSLFDFETRFMPINQDVAPPPGLVNDALVGTQPQERVVLNHGAIACLQACCALLDDTGFVLVNDYGPVQHDEVAGHSASQRFGPTSALGLNFPFLERFFGRTHQVVTPRDDEQRGIHSRLLLRRDLPATVAAYHDRFGPAGVDFFEAPVEEARRHLAAGRRDEALASWRLALSRSPREWPLMGEIAEFVGLQLRDLAAGRELARAALARNPWYSPWLWNVLGDIQFLDGDVVGAHEAYLQAQRIHPRDARTHLNLAYTHAEFGEHDRALQALAVALASDLRSVHRARLLEKQQQILGALTSRWLGEQERLARRAQRML